MTFNDMVQKQRMKNVSLRKDEDEFSAYQYDFEEYVANIKYGIESIGRDLQDLKNFLQTEILSKNSWDECRGDMNSSLFFKISCVQISLDGLKETLDYDETA